MFVNKLAKEEPICHDTEEDDKSSLTMLNPITYESAENAEWMSCCKYEPPINPRSKNYESERGS